MNGKLLRLEIHKLFDAGYITITEDLKIEVSRRKPHPLPYPLKRKGEGVLAVLSVDTSF